MSGKPEKKFSFVNEFPPITTGQLLLEKNIIITGHYNGFVVKWEIDSGQYEILQDCGDTVETLSLSPDNQILVGCNSGLIFYFELSEPKKRVIIQDSSNSKSFRVWRSVWPTDDNFLTTSTYGGLNLFYKSDLQWDKKSLEGHYHSIFGITNENGKFLVSGDYDGHVIIWERQQDKYNSIYELKLESSIEDIVWIKEESFATIDDLGHVNIIEFDPTRQIWKSVMGVNIATSRGRCIHATHDGKTVFAGTRTELIQYDVDTQRIQSIKLQNTEKIFSQNNTIYVLTQDGLFTFERSVIDVPLELIKYQYAKVSLIGHTGVGKSTLCSKITGSSDNVKSTFGKKIWGMTLPDDEGPEKRIIFHDHGGQETVLGTFLPFLSDSNIVLVFFAKNDKTTFEKAIEIIDELKDILSKNSKIFLVQTFIDEEINDVDENLISQLIKSKEVSDCLNISSKTDEGIPEFLERLKKEIDWSSSKIMAQSGYVEGLMKTISELSRNDGTVVSFYSVKNKFEERSNLNIPTSHLDFLLSSFSSQGLIEYYPDILKSVIFYHDEYNKLRTNIPILADQASGILSIKEVENAFGQSSYLQILDSVFQKFSIAIKDNDLRIFPSKLKPIGITIPEPYQSLLKKPLHKKDLSFDSQKIKLNSLIDSLIDLKLHCITASKVDGLFSWDTNACIYYSISEEGNSIIGRFIKISYFIGGKNNKICDKLNQEFSSILLRLFGPELSEKQNTG